MSSPVDLHVLHAFALARSTGAPALACLAGVGLTRSGTFGLPDAPAQWSSSAGLLEVAVLADLALGASARAEGGADRWMPTLSMTIDLAGSIPPAARLDVITNTPALEGGFISTAGTVRDGDKVIGHCAATFALGSAGSSVLPWEAEARTAVEPLTEHDLDDAERRMLDVITAANGRGWSDAVLDAAVTRAEPLQLTASALMANRFGAVQGGVLFALAARAAATAVDGPVRMRGGHVDFLAAGDITQPLDTLSTLLSAGRRTSFARADIRQGDRLVAAGSFVQHVLPATDH